MLSLLCYKSSKINQIIIAPTNFPKRVLKYNYTCSLFAQGIAKYVYNKKKVHSHTHTYTPKHKETNDFGNNEESSREQHGNIYSYQ